MNGHGEMADLGSLSRLELISLYINGYGSLDADQRSQFEIEFHRRGLPLPRMSPLRAAAPRPAPRRGDIDRSTLFSYILLIYTGTAVFYSWFYLAARLLKMDFRRNLKHKLIQSAISLFYVIIDILLVQCLVNLE